MALQHVPGGTRIERHQHPRHQLIYVSTRVLVAQTSAGSSVASCHRAIWMPATPATLTLSRDPPAGEDRRCGNGDDDRCARKYGLHPIARSGQR
jgi:hypothetical protein